MNKILLKTTEYVVRWRPGVLRIELNVRFTALFSLTWILLGGFLIVDPLHLPDVAGVGQNMWSHILFYSGIVASLPGVIILLQAIRTSLFVYPITINGMLSTIGIGRNTYRFSDLSNVRIDRIQFGTKREFYALVADVAGNRKYLCQGVTEARLDQLKRVEESVLEIVRKPVSDQEGALTAPANSFLAGPRLFYTIGLITGAVIAIVARIYFPDYNLVSIFDPNGRGLPVWILGLYTVYGSILGLLGLPIKEVARRKFLVKGKKQTLTLVLAILPWILYFIYYNI